MFRLSFILYTILSVLQTFLFTFVPDKIDIVQFLFRKRAKSEILYVLPACKSYLEVSENRLTRWQLIQKLSQQFWNRWQAEYLQELQRRNKWTDGGGNIELNTLVLLKEDHVPPLHWILGRVTALFPGPDGVVRVVSVRTQNGEIKRSIKGLCPIPRDDIKQIA